MFLLSNEVCCIRNWNKVRDILFVYHSESRILPTLTDITWVYFVLRCTTLLWQKLLFPHEEKCLSHTHRNFYFHRKKKPHSVSSNQKQSDLSGTKNNLLTNCWVVTHTHHFQYHKYFCSKRNLYTYILL